MLDVVFVYDGADVYFFVVLDYVVATVDVYSVDVVVAFDVENICCVVAFDDEDPDGVDGGVFGDEAAAGHASIEQNGRGEENEPDALQLIRHHALVQYSTDNRFDSLI